MQITAIVAIAAALAGCAGFQMHRRTIEHNEAVASASNELLLLNAVRAAKRYPLYYSALGGANGQPSLSGSTQLNFPFGPDAKHVNAFNNTFNYNAGISSFTMANLSSKELAKITENVPPEIYVYFRENDWPRELVDVMLIRRFQVGKAEMAAINAQVHQVCTSASERGARRDEELCHYIKEPVQGCPVDDERIFNSARNVCDYGQFLSFIRKLRLLQYEVIAPSRNRGVRIDDRKLLIGTQVFLRSPEAIIEYLGQVVAAQHLIERKFIPRILIASPRRAEGGQQFEIVRLFWVAQSLPPGATPAVRVEHEGEFYYIPRPNFGAPDEDRSLQVLALVNNVMVRNIEGTALRAPAVLIAPN